MTVKPIPDGYHTVTPHLIIDGAAKALDFYRQAFGADILARHPVEGSDKLMHASIAIGDSIVMLADQFPDWGSFGPDRSRNSPVVLNIYSDDVDTAWQRAVDAGAKIVMPLENMFWSDRYGVLEDPFGHRWSMAQHIEDPSPEEIAERSKSAFPG